MFEQATLTNGPAGKRIWTAMLGATTQVALVSFAALVPMVWPQVLPTASILETLAPPLPPSPAPKQLGETKRQAIRSSGARQSAWRSVFVVPMRIPPGPIPILQDEPAGPSVVGVPEGFGRPDGVVDSLMQDMARSTLAVAAPPIPKPVPKTPPAEAAPVIRYKLGGDVHLGALLHKVEPRYPQIAKDAHVSGPVELECVVGVDGRITEVKVKGGHPLLVRAAVDAAWQWVYAPSKLNGLPIEIITILKFTFKLN